MTETDALAKLLKELKRQRPYPRWQPEQGEDGRWYLNSTQYDGTLDVTALAEALARK